VCQRFIIDTLGCKANAYDSRRLAEALQAMGWQECTPSADDTPDACIVNTCTVTHVADRKSRQRLARLARRHPRARVFATGCYATAAADELRAVAGVAGVFPRDEWPALIEAVCGRSAGAAALAHCGDFGISSFGPAGSDGGRMRAFLKLQDGCDAFCAYCIIPHTRGAPRSRPVADVAAEAARLADAGCPEIVLTGIHIGFYGRDLPSRPSLADAVLAAAEAPGVERVRVSSIEATEVSDQLLAAMAGPRVCAHLHLPLQSGDARTLARMGRRYTPEKFLACVARARARLDQPAITADVLVGFPGETDSEFRNTAALCCRAAFSRLHVFPFSARRGTPAATMPDPVPPDTAHARAAELRELGREMAEQWAQRFVGRPERVLFERRTARGALRGYTDRYVPAIAEGDDARPGLLGRTVPVRGVARRGGALLVRAVAGA